MYRYLDRRLSDLDAGTAMLINAMRDWVAAVQGGRCPCARAAHRFDTAGLGEIVPDFAMMMFTLDGDAKVTLRFAPPGGACVSDDEARLFALLDAPVGNDPAIVRRLAAGLVVEAAVPRLARAASVVAAAIAAANISIRFDR